MIAADILARHHTLLNGALLVSCRCDVPQWRHYMRTVQRDNAWSLPVRSLSPMALVEHVDPGACIIVIFGDRDEIVPTGIGRTYLTGWRVKGHAWSASS